MREPYISHPSSMRCSLAAVDNGKLLGVQSLIYAIDGNPYAPSSAGIIGTRVDPDAARSDAGRKRFQVTRAAAIEAGLENIEALPDTKTMSPKPSTSVWASEHTEAVKPQSARIGRPPYHLLSERSRARTCCSVTGRSSCASTPTSNCLGSGFRRPCECPWRLIDFLPIWFQVLNA